MGINLKDLVTAHEIGWEELRGKSIAIDAMNNLYQFLATIRQPDGTPLMDSHGRTTSHLSGVFYRTIRIYENSIKPCYVFDGKPHALKKEEIMRRKELKEGAMEKYEDAKSKGDMEAMKKFASRTSRFTPEMIDDAVDVIDAMGIPIVLAPSEGEMQCSFMAGEGDVYATGSQDYDSLLCGSPILLKNLTMVEKFQPEKILLKETLSNLGITREDLIDLAILIGTDFNPGVKGIGPKKGLKIVKDKGMDKFKKDIHNLEELRGIFLKPKITKDYKLKWKAPDREKLIEILSEKHEFSERRIDRGVKRLEEAYNKNITQSSLSKWFG